jgi:hemerythrin superfamily protein
MSDGFELLEHDHRAIERLFAQYEKTAENATAQEIGLQLAIHTEIEELVVYPVLRDVPGGSDLTDRAEVEHGVVATLLARMWDSPPADLTDLMRAVERQVTSHVEDEEHRYFPLMREHGVDADRLGRDLEEAREGARHRIAGTRASLAPDGQRLRASTTPT